MQLRLSWIATGSEVRIAIEARDLLHDRDIPTRVVSMPCLEWFAAQPADYRDEVLPPAVTNRDSVEASIATGWREIVGSAGHIVSIDDGASADAVTRTGNSGSHRPREQGG